MDRGGATGVARSGCAGSGGRARLDAAGVQQVGQFAGLEHLADDVAAAHELALDVELRDGRPGRIVLDPVADRRVLEHVDALELDAEVAQHLNDYGREAALRERSEEHTSELQSLMRI